jgi:glycosyltransferase involved in cell wall biosynthesis
LPAVLAVLIPCYNEAPAIRKVINDFRAALPDAAIFVYDNNSTDGTADVARAAGAIVRTEWRRGKGNVVRRMFADVEADIYVLVDGDDTYHAASAPLLIDELLRNSLDMVSAIRVENSDAAYRMGHRFGNQMLTGLVAWIFGRQSEDMLSGYRIFSRRFVKSFPALAAGFEIETELTVHALELGLPVSELKTPYSERPAGTASKLRTYHDGARIMYTIVQLIKEEKPLAFFGGFALFLVAISLLLAFPIVVTYRETGLVPRLPTAILATSLMMIAFLSLTCGMVLDTVTRGRREFKRLAYLSIPIRFTRSRHEQT